jgi:crossover junction endodeoxyribonuclease RuvC
MVVLGIDPGLAQTGHGVVEFTQNRFIVREYGAIRTLAAGSRPQRVQQIHEAVVHLIAVHRPEVLVLEKLFKLRDGSTGLAVGQAMGVILLAAAQAGLPVVEYAPPAIKQAVVGFGEASKEQVQYMVQRLLHLDRTPRPHHAADALAVCICHIHSSLGWEAGPEAPRTPLQARIQAELQAVRPNPHLQERIAQALAKEEERQRAYRKGTGAQASDSET